MSKRPVLIVFAGVLACLGLMAWIGAALHDEMRDDAASELSGMESRLRFIRLPEHPAFCAAALPSAGGYAPRFFGVIPCAQVERRITLDQEMSDFLGDYVYRRVSGTQACLARSTRHGDSFAFACPSDFSASAE